MITKHDMIIQMTKNLELSRTVLVEWLSERLPKVSPHWWDECVLGNLSFYQHQRIKEHGIDRLASLDLAALLRVADRCWNQIRETHYMQYEWREAIKNLVSVRNNWAHATEETMTIDVIKPDMEVLIHFLELYSENSNAIKSIHEFIEQVKVVKPTIPQASFLTTSKVIQQAGSILINSLVSLVSDSSKRGYVVSIKDLDGTAQYSVFIDNAIRIFYEGQILPVYEASIQSIGIEMLRNALTAYNITNPSNKSLYSLHSARIDFVPYQFRPALKIIQSDSPRLLIADSVGVGKTIEAGLVLKELQARGEIDSVLIICPKPLVAERKWELEMNRFDESFVPISGPILRQIIYDTNRDGVWPERYRKAILPYSLLSSQLLYGVPGQKSRKAKGSGLLDLDPAPHFDLVIVDEAHHIRNSETYVHAAVSFFCDHADAVLFLTATPLQTGNEDLYTLLNTLRPDVVLDQATFQMMAQPNLFINKALHSVRTNIPEWKELAQASLSEAAQTQWGSMVIAPDPNYKLAMNKLTKTEMTDEERLHLVPIIEGFHSFHNMISRTRRQDIQDFCIRRTDTISVCFTPKQQLLHDELLRFEATALRFLHSNNNVSFMMSMLTRQAASCIFGLAPSIRGYIDRRFAQITDDPDIDFESIDQSTIIHKTVSDSAKQLLNLAEEIPEEDPKFESFIKLVIEKQKQENNKIIVFSTFLHTLAYLRKKLMTFPVRLSQVDGSTKDDLRYDLRRRFELNRQDQEAIDVMLFSEVGSEGLDYQFCDMMINYDLPWNPMRIEQRIGRIDRRGQKSEVVRIVNMVTEGTVDAEIYHRCLWRIGIFENNIGECAEILGEISGKIEEIVNSPELTPHERNEKFSRMADNEILQLQEMQKMEENEKHLFGFDFSLISRELSAAENPWITPAAIESLVNSFFSKIIGKGQYILGDGKLKTLRLSAQSRQALLPEKKNTNVTKSLLQKQWENYLKGTTPNCHVTFDSKCAEQNRSAFFFTNAHPLVRQAAQQFLTKDKLYLGVRAVQGELPVGQYPFAIYCWEYVGYRQQQILVPICANQQVQTELFKVLQEALSDSLQVEVFQEKWDMLEKNHFTLWDAAKKKQKLDAEASYRFRKQSLDYQIATRRRILQQRINDAYNENIIRMRTAELENAENKHSRQIAALENELKHSDIHVQLLINGVLNVMEAKT